MYVSANLYKCELAYKVADMIFQVLFSRDGNAKSYGVVKEGETHTAYIL